MTELHIRDLRVSIDTDGGEREILRGVNLTIKGNDDPLEPQRHASQGCDRHQFNTRHCEAKYYEYFSRVKEELESEFPDIVVSAKTGKPRVGAFEVRYSDAVRPARHQSSWTAWSLRGLGGF